MIINHIKHSLRLKIIIASVLVEIVMLGLLIANSTRLLNQATEKHTEILLTDIPPLLNAALAPMLFERDFAAIEDFMDDLVFNPRKGITNIAIYDQTGKLYGEWGKAEGETSRKPEDIPRDSLVKASFPLKLGNIVIGEVKCGLSLEHLQQSKQSLYRQGALIALTEVILTIVLLSIIGFVLTRHITKLVNGARAMAQGNYSVEITIPGSDEISQLSHDFNKMAVAVNERTASLRESEEKYRNLFESLQEGIWAIDKDAKTVFANSPMAEMLGYTEEEMLGKHLFEFMDVKGVEIAKENLKRREAGIPEQHDFEFLQKDGSRVYTIMEAKSLTDKDDNYAGAIAGVINVTDRKKAEEALREKEERYRMIIQTAMDGFWLTDMKGNFQEVNAAYAQMSGYSIEELMNMRISDIEASENPEEVARHIQKGIENGFDRFETVHSRKDESIFEVEINFRYLPIEGGRFVVFLRDITERKKLQAQLQQAHKMEAIGTLAGGIAHDFNNILSPIMIHSEMAMMELPSESPLQQNMNQIYQAGERARDLVKQILTFARKREGERVPIEISRILKEVIKFLRSSLPSTIDIQYNIETEQDAVLADPTQINQIIMNLCTNASHAMEEKGGTLEMILTNENIDSKSADAFPDLEPGRYVKLTVTDAGNGIEPQFMDKIFDPYFTTKEVGKGTGMGLSLVHGIVKRYGGEVTVQSELGKGTTFHVYLPLVEDDTVILETAKDSVQLPTGKERILFVDDEKAAVDVMQLMLEKLGYKVTGRTSSIEALEAFRNKPDAFDLVITDMTMPNMTGKDLAKEMMSIRSDISIILCTGFSEKIDERRAEEMGISAFVMKPIVMGQIANTIREVLDSAPSTF